MATPTPVLESKPGLSTSKTNRPLDKRLGRDVALASAYNLLHRHNYRKLVPDKRHPQSDPVAQQEWKKNSPKHSRKSTKTGRKANPSG